MFETKTLTDSLAIVIVLTGLLSLRVLIDLVLRAFLKICVVF